MRSRKQSHVSGKTYDDTRAILNQKQMEKEANLVLADG
jgi:hypothetical protein